MRAFRAALVASILVAAPSQAQSNAGGFAVLIGNDTIAFERFRRTGNRLDGELVDRASRLRRTYVAQIADGLITHLRTWVWGLSEPLTARPTRSANIVVRSDSAFLESTSSAGTQLYRIAIRPGSLPYINLSFALLELATVRAPSRGDGAAEVPLIVGLNVVPASVTRSRPDSVVVAIAGTAVELRVDDMGRILGGAIPAQRVRIDRADSVAASRFVVAVADYSAPSDAAYTAEEITIAAGAHRLVGTLTKPRTAAGPLPVAITVSGSGLQDRDEAILGLPGYRPFRQLAEALAGRGVAVFRYDDRGFGASTGDASASGLTEFADDLVAVIRTLRHRKDLDGSRIALIGHSEGGLISPRVAVSDSGIAAVVLMAGPGLPGPQVVESQLRYKVLIDSSIHPSVRDSALRAGRTAIDSIAITTRWMRDFLRSDPIDVITRVRQPVLILQGETDRQISADQAALLASALRGAGNSRVEVELFPGLNHLFLPDSVGNPAAYSRLATTQVPDAVLNRIAEWLAIVLKAQ